MADWLEGYREKREKALTKTAEPSPGGTQTGGARADLVGLQLGGPSNAAPAKTFDATPPAQEAAKPDPISIYSAEMAKTLLGNDSTVKNARQTASTQNAVGDYLAQRQAKQESVNAGYTPGTLQTQRVADRYQAGANETTLARDNQVNEMQRDRSDTAMSQANQLRMEGRQDIETLINSVKDPVLQSYLRQIQAAGGDVRAALAGTLSGGTGAGGTGAGYTGPTDEYGRPRSLSPAETTLKNAQDEAKTYGLVEGTPEYEEYVRARTIGASEGTVAPITDAEKARQKSARLENALTRGLQSLSDEEYEAFLGDLGQTITSAIPTSKSAIEAAKNDPATRGIIKTPDGQAYQIQDYLQTTRWKRDAGHDDRHSDWAVATNRAGETVYINADGEVVNFKPPSAPGGGKGDKVSLKDGVFVSDNGYKYDPVTQKWSRG